MTDKSKATKSLEASRDEYLAERVRDIAESIVDTTTIEGKTLLRVAERLVAHAVALRQIADHPVISEGAFPSDNCDWHCTVTITALAKDALNA